MTTSPELQEIVLVTGASSGIADAIRGPGIEPLILDITNPDHLRALAARVHEDPRGRAMRALVNNAGVGVNAPVEVFEMDEWRQLFEVNSSATSPSSRHCCRP